MCEHRAPRLNASPIVVKKISRRPGSVAHACNPSYLGVSDHLSHCAALLLFPKQELVFLPVLAWTAVHTACLANWLRRSPELFAGLSSTAEPPDLPGDRELQAS
jgi:hypothetical protein